MHVYSGLSNMNLSLCVFCKLIVVGLICLSLMCLMQEGITPLYFASKNDHTELVELLLKRGARVNQVQHTVINQSMHYI